MPSEGDHNLSSARLYFYSAVAFMLLLVTATAHANAASFPPRLLYAYELANERWGGPPTGCTAVTLEVVPNGSLGDAEGMATLPEPGAPPKPCFMQIIQRDAEPHWFMRACAVIRHEAGHLHGLDHTDTPGSIMNPAVTFVPSQCARAGLFLMNHPFYPQRRFR